MKSLRPGRVSQVDVFFLLDDHPPAKKKKTSFVLFFPFRFNLVTSLHMYHSSPSPHIVLHVLVLVHGFNWQLGPPMKIHPPKIFVHSLACLTIISTHTHTHTHRVDQSPNREIDGMLKVWKQQVLMGRAWLHIWRMEVGYITF